MMLSEFCSTFGTLHFEKSSNTALFLEKMMKNLPISLLLKWPLLEPKMFTVALYITGVARFYYSKTLTIVHTELNAYQICSNMTKFHFRLQEEVKCSHAKPS